MKWLNDIETYIYRVEDKHYKDDNWVVSDWDCEGNFFKTKADAISYVRRYKKDLQEEYKEHVKELQGEQNDWKTRNN